MRWGAGRGGGEHPPRARWLFTGRCELRDQGQTSRWKGTWGWKQHVPQVRVSFRAGGPFLCALLRAFKPWSSEVPTILLGKLYGMLALHRIIQGGSRLGKAAKETLPCSHLALAAMGASSFCKPSPCNVAGMRAPGFQWPRGARSRCWHGLHAHCPTSRGETWSVSRKGCQTRMPLAEDRAIF